MRDTGLSPTPPGAGPGLSAHPSKPALLPALALPFPAPARTPPRPSEGEAGQEQRPELRVHRPQPTGARTEQRAGQAGSEQQQPALTWLWSAAVRQWSGGHARCSVGLLSPPSPSAAVAAVWGLAPHLLLFTRAKAATRHGCRSSKDLQGRIWPPE